MNRTLTRRNRLESLKKVLRRETMNLGSYEQLSYSGPNGSQRTVTCSPSIGGVRFHVTLPDGTSPPDGETLDVTGFDGVSYRLWCTAADFVYTLHSQSIANPENGTWDGLIAGILDENGNRMGVAIEYNAPFPDGPLWNVTPP